MRFEKEAWERYSVYQNRAKRIARKNSANVEMEALPLLKTVLDTYNVAGETDLGVVKIPVKQIVGVVAEEDRDAYVSDFFPLPSVNSEFAEKWTMMFMENLSDAGLSNPIRCYEFLGKFYVVDGKKRVSAAKAQGTIMIDAQVTRILPVETDDPEIQSYYEFVKTYEKTGLYQIAFTQPGKADSFLKAMGYEPDHTWSEMDRFSFMFHWYPFDRALEVAFDNQLNITTADTVLVLLRNHSIAELRKLQSWVLAEMMQDASADLFKIGIVILFPASLSLRRLPNYYPNGGLRHAMMTACSFSDP